MLTYLLAFLTSYPELSFAGLLGWDRPSSEATHHGATPDTNAYRGYDSLTDTPNDHLLDLPTTRTSFVRHTFSHSLQEPRTPSWLSASSSPSSVRTQRAPGAASSDLHAHHRMATNAANINERGVDLWNHPPMSDLNLNGRDGHAPPPHLLLSAESTQRAWEDFSGSSQSRGSSTPQTDQSGADRSSTDHSNNETLLPLRADSTASSLAERLALTPAERAHALALSQGNSVLDRSWPAPESLTSFAALHSHLDSMPYHAWGTNNTVDPLFKAESHARVPPEFSASQGDPWSYTSSMNEPHPAFTPAPQSTSATNSTSPSSTSVHADSASQPASEQGSSAPSQTARNECELCGAKSSLLTILYPCEHRACSFCMSSGLNQVSTSPPRPHACAACGSHVEGIGIDKKGLNLANWAQSVNSTSKDASNARNWRNGMDRKNHSSGDLSSVSKESSNLSPDQSIDSSASARLVSNGGLLTTDLQNTPRTSDGGHSDATTIASQYNVKDIESLVSEMKLVPEGLREVPSSPHVNESSREEASEFCSLATLSVVRVDNIPWTTTICNVHAWIPEDLHVLPPTDLVVQPVHIPIDVSNGKTSNACFIECASRRAAMRLIRYRNNFRLCGRPVSLIHSKYHDLLNEVFPSRVQASTSAMGSIQTDTRPGLPAFDQASQHSRFFTPKHLTQLLKLARFSSQQLKDPVMPIEYITSMVCLLPSQLAPDQTALLTSTLQRMSCLFPLCFYFP